jgi:triosephosphate isomerase
VPAAGRFPNIMNKERRLIIAGNWKMNKTVAEALDLVHGLKIELASVKEVDLVVCPPFTALADVSKAIMDSNLRLGAQNMSEHIVTALSPARSPPGCSRNFPCATSSWATPSAASSTRKPPTWSPKRRAPPMPPRSSPLSASAKPCRNAKAGKTESVLDAQVRGSLAGLTGEQIEETILAYEPVWAIGTGKTATTAQAQQAHAFIRKLLASIFDENAARRVRIQYGGSVKPSNARELMSLPDVDGALVGGASLEDRSFSDIVKNSI